MVLKFSYLNWVAKDGPPAERRKAQERRHKKGPSRKKDPEVHSK